MAEKHSLLHNAEGAELLRQIELAAGWTEIHTAVAVSGGADSVALLLAMHTLKSRQGGAGRLLAMHVNHQLRGKESDADAAWLQQLCGQRQIPLQVIQADTANFAEQESCGLEAAARQLRYQLLTECAEQMGVRYLAVAHTRDDQVETILFRTLRGTGLRGLAGIPSSRRLTESLTLIRPLLTCSRATVIEYLTAIDQSYRTDSSNQDRRFTRNKLRHDLLPTLREQYNSELDEALLRLANQASEAQSVIESLATELLQQAKLEIQPSQLSLDRTVLCSMEPILVSEALRLAWRQANLPEQAMTFQWWRELAELMSQDSSSTLNLPGKITAHLQGNLLVLAW